MQGETSSESGESQGLDEGLTEDEQEASHDVEPEAHCNSEIGSAAMSRQASSPESQQSGSRVLSEDARCPFEALRHELLHEHVLLPFDTRFALAKAEVLGNKSGVLLQAQPVVSQHICPGQFESESGPEQSKWWRFGCWHFLSLQQQLVTAVRLFSLPAFRVFGYGAKQRHSGARRWKGGMVHCTAARQAVFDPAWAASSTYHAGGGLPPHEYEDRGRHDSPLLRAVSISAHFRLPILLQTGEESHTDEALAFAGTCTSLRTAYLRTTSCQAVTTSAKESLEHVSQASSSITSARTSVTASCTAPSRTGHSTRTKLVLFANPADAFSILDPPMAGSKSIQAR